MKIEDKVKSQIWRQRFGYGISDLAANLIWQMITLYLMYFYTDVMKLNALSLATMLIIARLIDGGADLLVGYWIDNTNTRWGKSRPYFLFGGPFFAFSVPDISEYGKLVYAYITYIGLSFAYTIVNIPMASILPSLTADSKERTALSTSRKFFGFLGATIVSTMALKMVEFFGGSNEALGFRFVMILFGIAGCILFWITFANVKERVSQISPHVTLGDTLKSLIRNKPWVIFAINILFMWTGYFMQTAALVYYCSKHNVCSSFDGKFFCSIFGRKTWKKESLYISSFNSAYRYYIYLDFRCKLYWNYYRCFSYCSRVWC